VTPSIVIVAVRSAPAGGAATADVHGRRASMPVRPELRRNLANLANLHRRLREALARRRNYRAFTR
jgi:hypothetical protein